MTIYTQDPGQGINQPISNAPSGLGESLGATFQQGFDDGPFNAALRLNRAQGLLNDDSPMVNKAEADEQLKNYGVKSITIPEEGVTQSYLDNVISNRKDTLAKQQIAASAPSGFVATPLNILSGLAGSMSDPANLAIGLIPFVGEAKAATVLGRAGERLVQGAAIGTAQVGVTLPATAMASASEGNDYTLGNAMESLMYGAVGGGVLHAAGGLIADAIRGPRATASSNDSALSNQESPLGGSGPDDFVDTPSYIRAGRDLDMSDPQVVRSSASGRLDDFDTSSPFLNETIAREADNYSYSRAYDDVVPDYQQSLHDLQSGRVGNVADLRAEIAENNRQATALDATLRDRTDQYQQQRYKFKEAQQRARADIERDKQALQSRNDEIGGVLEKNAAAERASSELSAIGRGELPDNLKSSISSRAAVIKAGLQQTALAQGVRTAAQRIADTNWVQRENAFRAGLSHMLQGKSPDVEPMFDINQPALRDSAMIQIRQGPRSDVEPSTINASSQAEIDYRRTVKEDSELNSALEDLEAEIGLARSRIDEIDSPELRQALDDIQKQANDESLQKGYDAYAGCMLRRL